MKGQTLNRIRIEYTEYKVLTIVDSQNSRIRCFHRRTCSESAGITAPQPARALFS